MQALPNAVPHKNTLEIRLAESVVLLRGGDGTGRLRNIPPDTPPGMVRGLLVLSLAKPTKITSIEIELTCKTMTAWPEGAGARRIEVSEDHEVHSQSYIYFRAGQAPGTGHRRTLSVGPGLALDHDEEEHSENASVFHAEPPPPAERRPPSPIVTRHNRRPMSMDHTHFQRGFVAHRQNIAAPPTPPQSPPMSPDASVHRPVAPNGSPSISQRSLAPLDDGSARSLEEFRRAFQASLGDVPTEARREGSRSRSRTPAGSSRSSMRSPRDLLGSRRMSMDESRRASIDDTHRLHADDTRRVSIDEHRDPHAGSSTLRAPPSASASLAASPTASTYRDRYRDDEHEETVRGRKRKSLGFASALFEAMRETVQSRSAAIDRSHRENVTPPRGRTMDRNAHEETEDAEHLARKERSTLGRVGELFGRESEEKREHREEWKEFRKGVYTYPISFAIPVSSPPTMSVDYGTVMWRLKAAAHRPGAFKAKLSAFQEVTVVAAPGEDDTEESESIIVERQWDTQMQYLIAISGRSFVIGGSMPTTITFMPWTKMKIYRISVLLEEKVDYFSHFKRLVRTDILNRVALFSLRHHRKDNPALLPLVSDDTEIFAHSPLHNAAEPDDDIGELIANYMGPGPWTIRKTLQIPNAPHLIHPTNKNRRANVLITHLLKIIFRVERGDDVAMDEKTGKRKLFDIVVQTPVHILSPLCNTDYISLPPYSRVSLPTNLPTMATPVAAAALGIVPEDDALGSPAYPETSRPAYSRLTTESSIESVLHRDHHHGTSATVVTPPLSRPHSESALREIGEAPPSYETAVESPHRPPPLALPVH